MEESIPIGDLLNIDDFLMLHALHVRITETNIDPLVVNNELSAGSAATGPKTRVVHRPRIFIRQQHLRRRIYYSGDLHALGWKVLAVDIRVHAEVHPQGPPNLAAAR